VKNKTPLLIQGGAFCFSETFERYDLDGKQLLRALDEYLDLTKELRAGIDPMVAPFSSCKKVTRSRSLRPFTLSYGAMTGCLMPTNSTFRTRRKAKEMATRSRSSYVLF
jgi:hypothetical protein